MKSYIIYLFANEQDWPAEYGSIDLCATSEYPNKKDVLKNIVHAMGCTSCGQEVKEMYEKLDREINYEILYDLSDPGKKRTLTEKADFPYQFVYYEEGKEGLEFQYVPEGYTTQKEYRVGARYFIRISSENEELLEDVVYALEHPYGGFPLGVDCAGNCYVIKDEENEIDFLLKAIRRRCA